jgi:hypothetical protein
VDETEKILRRNFMKRIFIFALCLALIFVLDLCVFAEAPTETAVTEETEAFPDLPEAETEVTAQPESSDGGESLLSARFEAWVLPHLEEISVVVTLLFSLVYQIRKNKLLGKSMGVMNDNAVTIAEQSSGMMAQALAGMESAALAVKGYDERIAALLEAHDATAADKERLERELLEVKAYLKSAAEANLEFSNELAELLSLANIPNFKKEEIGARHLAAVRAMKAAEEVTGDVGEKA